MKSSKASNNILEMMPKIKKGIKWKEKDGRVVVKVPKFRSALGRDICLLLGVSQTFDLHLDELGTFVWKCITEKKRVCEIANEIEKKFGEKAEPVLHRLVKFIELLENNDLIFMMQCPPDEERKSRKRLRRA